MIRIDSQVVRQQLINSPEQAFMYTSKLLPELLKQKSVELRNWLEKSYEQLAELVYSVETFVAQRTALIMCNSNIEAKKEALDTIGLCYKTCQMYEIEVEQEDRDYFTDILALMNSLSTQVILVESNMDKNMNFFRRELEKAVPKVISDAQLLIRDILNKKFLDVEQNPQDLLVEITSLDEVCKTYEDIASKYRHYQIILEVAQSQFTEVSYAREQLDLRLKLWKGLIEWKVLRDGWIDMPYSQINIKEITSISDEYAKTVTRCVHNLPESTAVNQLKLLVGQFRETMPVVSAMRNEDLLQEHWDVIYETIGQEFDITDPNFTLKNLIELNVMQHMETIQQISIQAAQEANLKTQLAQVKAVWAKADIPVKNYKNSKDNFILDDLEDLLASLDESLAILSTIASNQYVGAIRNDVENWQKTLNLVQDVLDEWITCQKNWMYMANIFTGSSEIKKSLPHEAQQFDIVDKDFKKIMRTASQSQNAVKVAAKQYLLDSFRKHNKTLEDIQRGLENFLEAKRRIFPRFYFLSNDELLQILANSADVAAVQPHLKKCFDNIVRLDIVEESADIQNMISAEGEKVPLGRGLKARGPVEEWLGTVQNGMMDALLKAMGFGYQDYIEQGSRKDWVMDQVHPGQIITTVAIIM